MERLKVNIPSVECSNCNRGWSLDENHGDLLICPQCGNKFSKTIGIINSITSENIFSLYDFVSNSWFIAQAQVKVGVAQYIEFPKKLKDVLKVFITPESPCYIDATNVSNSGFLLMSSCGIGNEELLGEEVTCSIHVYGRHSDYKESWRQFLTYSREQFLLEKYVSSIILCEIAFESFIDACLTEGYMKIGIDEDSISRFLVSSEMPAKVNPLMSNIFGVKLKDSDIWSDWEKKVLKWRNEIAHGRKTSATREEAQLTFSTIIRAIFYLGDAVFNKIGDE